MSRLDGIQRWLDEELPALLPEYDVPAMAIAVAAGDELIEAGATSTVFQLCSVTKVWTATLVMQLVDDGLLDLDVPVRTYLPGFRVADGAASEQITARHLLSHSSGFDGPSPDGPDGPDAIRWYVEEVLQTAPQLFPPGQIYSYGTGFVVLGRIIEVLRGRPYNEVLLERLAEPLGLERVTMIDCPGQGWNDPSGTRLSMPVGELARFGRLHLDGGLAPDGTRVLSEASVQAMREPQLVLPAVRYRSGWQGLGWKLSDWPGGPVPGHGGGGAGQESNLQTAPAHRVAVAGLSHGGSAYALFLRLFDRIFRELSDIRVPMPPSPPAVPAPIPDPGRYTGTYAALESRFEIEAAGPGELLVRRGTDDPFLLVWLGDDRFTTVERRYGVHVPHAFVGDTPDGRAAYFHTSRAFPRAG